MGSQAIAVRRCIVHALHVAGTPPVARVLYTLGMPPRLRVDHVLPQRSRVYRDRIECPRDRQDRGAGGFRLVHTFDVRHVRGGMGRVVPRGAQVPCVGELLRQEGHVRDVRIMALPVACRGGRVDARMLHIQRCRRRMLEGERVGGSISFVHSLIFSGIIFIYELKHI